jgi:adenosylmethionine-8-amino-7-oxononanoate aminotransferase
MKGRAIDMTEKQQASWEERDLAHIWHPCSQMKDYETLPPMVIDHAKGPWLYDIHGKKYLDIVSSWWANLLGHCNPEINEAIKEQLDSLEHVIFANFSHRPAIELAERLAEITPDRINKFHFNDNGSSSVEAALKMCFQFYHQTGKPEKQRFMCLTEGYHGETIGALSVGSMDLFAKMYQPMMMDNIHVQAPDCYRCPYGKDREHCACECFEHAEKAFAEHAHETAAMIVEPLLQGSAGMRIYPPLYLKKLRALCDKYDVKLIADEIATGFGRTGTMFACEQAGISPDVMTISKGLTGGYLPMSVTCVSDEIYDAFYADYGEGKAFPHSHTYAGNPIGCATALAVQKIMKEQHILETAAENAKWLTAELSKAFAHHPNVGEIRHIGLIHAIELVKDPETKEPLDAKKRTGYAIYKKALERGLVLRPLGDILYFNPPLNITREELSTAIELAHESITDILPE